MSDPFDFSRGALGRAMMGVALRELEQRILQASALLAEIPEEVLEMIAESSNDLVKNPPTDRKVMPEDIAIAGTLRDLFTATADFNRASRAHALARAKQMIAGMEEKPKHNV